MALTTTGRDPDAKAARRQAVYSAVEALLPKFREREASTRQQRMLPAQSIAELKQAGYFRVLQPERYGGLELDPADFGRLVLMVAEHCAATGWVCGVIGIHPFQLALYDQRAQEEVWGDDPDTLVSSSYAPMGKVQRCDGGFRFSGRWGWSSGCDHCEWVLLGGLIFDEGDVHYRTFLVPRSDYEIDDTWHAMGLQGTGSKDIVVADTFVPEYRTHHQMDGFNLTNPGYEIHDNPLYRIPWGQLFVRAVSTAPICLLKRIVELRIDGAKNQHSGDPTKLAADVTTQELLARASNTIDELETVLFRNMEQLMQCVENDGEIPMELRVRNRYQASIVVERCLEAAQPLIATAGGRSVFLGSEIQQAYLDLLCSRSHVANNPTSFARNYGAVLLGQDNSDVFL